MAGAGACAQGEKLRRLTAFEFMDPYFHLVRNIVLFSLLVLKESITTGNVGFLFYFFPGDLNKWRLKFLGRPF